MLGMGCGRSELNNEQAASSAAVMAASPDAVARIHWLGRKRLDLDADAYVVSRIWSLPQSKQLQLQISDKLTTNAMRMVLGDAITRIPAAVFRPLFDDIVLQECYFEMRQGTNAQTPEWCFAIQAGEQRAGSWVTNIALAAELGMGGSASPEPSIHGLTIRGTNAARSVRVSRIKDWVVVALGTAKSPLFEDVASHLLHNRPRLIAGTTNYWIEADIDLSRAAQFFTASGKTDSSLPRVELNVTGDGGHVLTEARLKFPEVLSMPMEDWRIPTNAIHEPLLTFTAARGIQSLLAKWQERNGFHVIPAPNQLFLWSLDGNAVETFAAVPSSDARGEVSALSDFLLQKANPWLETNGYIGFHRVADADGVVWGNVPSLAPFVRSLGSGKEGWVYAGLLADPGFGTNAPMPNSMVQTLAGGTNLVYYDWESTGKLLSPRLSLFQTARQIARKPSMPTDCDSLNWLVVLIRRLGITETTMMQTSSTELTFHRKSTIGFTALELHLLADWLESPGFPVGTYSLDASPAGTQ